MNTTEIIQKKIESLGGVDRNPLCKNEAHAQDNSHIFFEMEKFIEGVLPSSYKEFYNLYNSFSFNKNVKSILLESSPFQDNSGLVAIDYFYSLEKNLNCSVDVIFSRDSFFKENKLLPICDGESGDLICIDLTDERYENVFYWFHESPMDDQLFLVAKNFTDFLLNLQVVEEEHVDPKVLMNVKVSATPALLAMLKKSGYGPKE